jgi:hypothetical protein
MIVTFGSAKATSLFPLLWSDTLHHSFAFEQHLLHFFNIQTLLTLFAPQEQCPGVKLNGVIGAVGVVAEAKECCKESAGKLSLRLLLPSAAIAIV